MIVIPSSTLEGLKQIPCDQSAVLLLRHSERPPIPLGQTGDDLPLTEQGSWLALTLGQHLNGRLRSLSTSPVRRCMETAELLQLGANVDDVLIQPDHLLGDPGIFITEPSLAWQTVQRLGMEQVMTRLMNKDSQLPGFSNPVNAVSELINHTLCQMQSGPGLHLFVTHDFFITTTVAMVLNRPLPVEDWPDFIEGVFFFHDGKQLIMRYKHYKGVVMPCPLS
ncbi:MAG: histidine phosphatase family protein [Candidatus Parabeggiatoa sp.]|nr:histidine phosphatase family protein [Candidatus Parabeggiatoa sp.]